MIVTVFENGFIHWTHDNDRGQGLDGVGVGSLSTVLERQPVSQLGDGGRGDPTDRDRS